MADWADEKARKVFSDFCATTVVGKDVDIIAQALREAEERGMQKLRDKVGKALDPHYSPGGDVVWLAENLSTNAKAILDELNRLRAQSGTERKS